MHGTLQLVDLHSLDGLDGIARSQAEAEGVDSIAGDRGRVGSSRCHGAHRADPHLGPALARDVRRGARRWRDGRGLRRPAGRRRRRGAGGARLQDRLGEHRTTRWPNAPSGTACRRPPTHWRSRRSPAVTVTRAAFLFLSKGQALESDVARSRQRRRPRSEPCWPGCEGSGVTVEQLTCGVG